MTSEPTEPQVDTPDDFARALLRSIEGGGVYGRDFGMFGDVANLPPEFTQHPAFRLLLAERSKARRRPRRSGRHKSASEKGA